MTRSSACWRSTRARCARSCAASARGRCCSGTSSATSSTATASSSTSPRAGAPRQHSCRPRRCSSSTATTRRSATSPAGASGRSPTASTTRARSARRCSTPPTRATASAAVTRTSSRPRTSGTSATTAALRAATPGRSCRCGRGRSSSTGSRLRLRPGHARRVDARRAAAARASTTSTTRVGAAALAQALGATLDEISEGLARFGAAFGRFERIAAGDKAILLLLIKNPAGANEVVRTLEEGGSPPLLLIALNDAIADGKDVSWIWDIDLEPLLGGLETLIASGDRAAELGDPLRARRPARRSALEVEPDLAQGTRPRPRAHSGRRRARRPPHLHRDARAPAARHRARARRAVLGARREDPRRAPLSRST